MRGGLGYVGALGVAWGLLFLDPLIVAASFSFLLSWQALALRGGRRRPSRPKG